MVKKAKKDKENNGNIEIELNGKKIEIGSKAVPSDEGESDEKKLKEGLEKIALEKIFETDKSDDEGGNGDG